MQNTPSIANSGLEKILFKRLPKSSRAENVYEVVREGILMGFWRPGDRINDLELSQKLGVSRLSVREALSKFVESKILERKHWKGYEVRKLSWKEIEDMLMVRTALEVLALEEAFDRLGNASLNQLEEVLQEARRCLDAGNVQGFRTADFHFHEIFYQLADNVWITQIISNLKFFIEIIRYLSQADEFFLVAKESTAEHAAILEALRGGMKEEAVIRLKRHLFNHKERVRREYKQQMEANLGGSPPI